jgi:nitroreductase
MPKPTSPVLEAIYNRRSIREFTDAPISPDTIYEIINAGIWAPSGLNNQPWRFVVVGGKTIRDNLAQLTKYSHIISQSQICIAVYLDKKVMYNDVKDHQAAGACIQNMLLAAEACGLGAVWLGQILANKDQVNDLLGLDSNYDLMAVLALGHPKHHNQKSKRKELKKFILNEL